MPTTSRWYITGTDTDVGKTVITSCLAEARRGAVAALKPIASGVSAGAGVDAERLGVAAGHAPRVWKTWPEPVSPHRAARGQAPALSEVVAWCSSFSEPHVLIEGAGGWRVPFAFELEEYLHRWELRDLVRHLPGEVIVVAANRLGVLNHTLLTVESIQADHFRVAGVVLNDAELKDASTPYNFQDLQQMLLIPVVRVPRFSVQDASARRTVGMAVWKAFSDRRSVDLTGDLE